MGAYDTDGCIGNKIELVYLSYILLMSAITKQLLINYILLPDEILTLVKDCIFTKVRKIPKNDPRYSMLATIAPKTYIGYNLVGVCLQKQGSNVCYLLYYSLNTTLITMYKRNDYYTNAFNRINIFRQI
jgi:hypothetical protein